MNDEQRNKLEIMLTELSNLQYNAHVAADRGTESVLVRAIKAYGECTDKIIEYVDSFVMGELDTTDPRAGLRRCIVDGDDSEVYFYHGCYTDANREECAKLEYQDGRTREAYWVDIRFVDVTEASDV